MVAAHWNTVDGAHGPHSPPYRGPDRGGGNRLGMGHGLEAEQDGEGIP